MPKATKTKARMTQASFQGKAQRVPVTIEITGFSDDGSIHLIYVHAPHDPQDFRLSIREARKDFRERVTQLLASIESDEFLPEGWGETDE